MTKNHITISLPPELIARLPEGNRSKFIAEAIEARLTGTAEIIPPVTTADTTKILLLEEKIRSRDEIISVYREVLGARTQPRIEAPGVEPAVPQTAMIEAEPKKRSFWDRFKRRAK